MLRTKEKFRKIAEKILNLTGKLRSKKKPSKVKKEEAPKQES